MKKILISIFVIVLLIGAVIPASSDISLEKNSFQIEVNHDDNFDLIIITESFLTSELESLVQHKNKYGVNTMIMTTEEIYSEYQGRDNAEKIKYFIKDAKEKWNISYVMLLGDQKYIPFILCIFNKILYLFSIIPSLVFVINFFSCHYHCVNTIFILMLN
jgi:hypothetical protein